MRKPINTFTRHVIAVKRSGFRGTRAIGLTIINIIIIYHALFIGGICRPVQPLWLGFNRRSIYTRMHLFHSTVLRIISDGMSTVRYFRERTVISDCTK